MSSVAQKATAKKRPSQNSQSSFFQKRAQTKLNVGKPNDKYEVQADKAADQVVANKAVSSNDTFFSPSPNVQKDERNEEIQQKPVVERITPGIQLKVEEDFSSDQNDVQQKADVEIQEKQEEEIQEQTGEELQEKSESKTDEEVQSQSDESQTEEGQLKAEDIKSNSVQLIAEEEVQEKSEKEIQEKSEDDIQEKVAEFQPKLDDDATTKTEDAQTKPEVQTPVPEPVQLKEQIAQPKAEAKTAPILQPKVEEEIQEKGEEEVQEKAEEEKELQMKGTPEGPPNSTTNFESHLQSSKGGGSPLPDGTKNEMESSFGADFSKVRIHTDKRAVSMNQTLGAQAFATGNNIYFNQGNFNPNSMGGKHLLAHELTHTIQQGASPQGNTIQAKELLQAFGFMDLIPGWIKNGARNIPGYMMFTVVAGYDPLIGENVERTPINLLQGLMGMVPFGNIIFEKLQAYGIIDQVFDWVNGKLNELGLTIQSILDMMEEAWDELSFPYTDALDVVARKFMALVGRVTAFAGGLIEQVMTWVKEALINFAEPFLAENKAWSLIKKIIRYDPLRDEEVNAPTVDILEDFLLLIGKETELEQMREKGTLQKTADWLDTQFGTFTSLLQQFRSVITSVWDAVQPGNLENIGDTLTALASQIGGLLQGVWDFALEVAAKVLDLVKESLLGYLSEQALTIRGYSLLRVIIGKDPFTNEVIERNVPNLIRGFMSLMSGGEEQYAQMVETGAIARIVGQIDAAVETLNMTPTAIVQMFMDLWNTFTINDLLNPIDAFLRIIEAFGAQIGRLVSFVAEIIRIVIVGVLEIMNFPFDLIGNIITRSMEAIEDIKNDPIGFLKNILHAIKQGFIQFFENILTHLVGGITGWLMSELEDANVPTLTDFSLQGVIAWVLEVLGVTMDAIWEKLADHPRIGPERVEQMKGAIDTLQGIWTFIQDVRERGMIAIWEKIKEQLSNLWGAVLSAVQGYIMEKIITQVTVKLMGMLDPTGIMAVVNSCIAFYAAVQSFIKYLREMLEIVNSFVNGVADVARGNVSTAANYLENTMGGAMPVVIGFLANQVGLGGIGERIASILESIREMVDEALTWLVNMAVDTGIGMLDSMMAFGGSVVDAVMGYLGLRKSFNVDGEGHSLYFRSGSEGVLMVASTPKTIEELVADRRSEIEAEQADNPSSENTTKLTALDTILSKNTDMRSKTVDYNAAVQSGSHTRPEALQEEIDNLMVEIIDHLIVAGMSSQGVNTIQTHVRFGADAGRATSVVAEPLTQLPGNTAGSEPFENPTGHAELVSDFGWTESERGRLWKRGHLLNHNLHGPGEARNMAMITTFSNNSMKTGIEEPAKSAVDANPNKVYYYDVQVSYFAANSSTPNIELFPNRLTIEFGEITGEQGNYVRARQNGRSFALDTPAKENYPNNAGTQTAQSDASFNESGASDLKFASDAAGKTIPKAVFTRIKNIRNRLPNRSFNSITHLTDELVASNASDSRYVSDLIDLATNTIFMDY